MEKIARRNNVAIERFGKGAIEFYNSSAWGKFLDKQMGSNRASGHAWTNREPDGMCS